MSLEITYGYTPEDIIPLHDLENRSFTRIFRWRRADLIDALKTHDVWLGRCDNKLVAYILVDVEKDTGHIISLCTSPESRRKGYAKALLETIEEFYKGKVKKLKLEVHVDNPAQVLYFNFGYRVTGVRYSYYANGSNAISMVKVL